MPLSRRTLLGTAALAALPVAAPAYAQGRIRPRSEWARGLPDPGRLSVEESVRTIVIHHSESPNTDKADQIPQRLRSFHRFHTRDRGWADVAYNFFVDPFGGLWEGRAGSLQAAVRGDATGGSQGFSQLICFIGDHSVTPPTDAALDAAAWLVAELARRHRVDLFAERVEFISRGSSLFPVGTPVSTGPLVGHRELSVTACPGDALQPLVRSRILPAAQRLVAPPPVPAPAPPPVPAAPPAPQASGPSTPEPAPDGLASAQTPPVDVTGDSEHPQPVEDSLATVEKGAWIALGTAAAAGAAVGLKRLT